jgi:hypothetical protein
MQITTSIIVPGSNKHLKPLVHAAVTGNILSQKMQF